MEQQSELGQVEKRTLKRKLVTACSRAGVRRNGPASGDGGGDRPMAERGETTGVRKDGRGRCLSRVEQSDPSDEWNG